MRAEKCLKTVSKLSIMVKQHIFNINSQSLLVEIIFIKRGNLSLILRLVLIYVHKNFLLLLCAALTRLVRPSREWWWIGPSAANKRCKTYCNQKYIILCWARDLCLRVNIYNNNMLSLRRQNTSCSARHEFSPCDPFISTQRAFEEHDELTSKSCLVANPIRQ